MTSKAQTSECFVYITLPGATEPVTVGRYELTKTRAGVPLGRFVYGRSYLARSDAVEIDPVELKLAQRTYQTTLLKGVFGALRDASPDYWGRLIIERHHGRRQLGELEYLLNSADDRAGALDFGTGPQPPAPRRQFNKTLDLAQLQKIADDILKDKQALKGPASQQAKRLLLINTAVGGARPKAVVEDKDGLWIAKFNRPDADKWNNARVERAMLMLAKSCGITVADSKLTSVGGRDVIIDAE
jgi:serine/threonine-protein kinase HipA